MRINVKFKIRLYLVLFLIFSIPFLGFPRYVFAVDAVAPSAIANLLISSVSNSGASLSWRSPGDDGGSQQAEYVVVISVDGMGSYYVEPLLAEGTNQMVNLLRIKNEGAGTMNARDDANYAITLPNHVTMATSRGVAGAAGHNWVENTIVLLTDTIADNKGSYVASFFDVAHDNGLRTGIWAGKTKFNLFQQSYSAISGAEDITGDDNGKDKIDYDKVVSGISAANLTTDFLTQLASNPFNLSFIQFQDPDAVGHSSGWDVDPDSNFAASLKAVDVQIGNILNAIEASPTLNGKTTVVLTADHGGHGTNHGDITNPLDYTIPFYVWGADVAHVDDLYSLNLSTRTAPASDANPTYSGSQPIRNGEVGNLALSFLGLDAIPNSTINSSQDLVTENFGTADSYDIRYSTSIINNDNWNIATPATGEPAPAIAGSTQTFSVSSLDSGTTYYFAIKTSDEVPNISGISNVASALTIPNDPSSCSAAHNSDTQFTVTWTNNSSLTTNFKIERKTDGGEWTQIGTDSASPYVDTTTLGNHSYQYRVKAYNSSGNSGYSTDLNTLYTTPLAPTIGVSTADSSTSITWNWTDNSSYEDYFRLHFVTGSDLTINNITSDLTSYTSSGLSPNTEYRAHIHSYRADRGESSASSNSAAIYTLANIPSSLALTINSANQITATWSNNSNPDGTSYFIENITASSNSGWITGRSWISSSLACNTTYSFKVKAKNGDDIQTTYSSIVSGTTSACSSGGGGGGGGWTPPALIKDIISFGFINAQGSVIGTNIFVNVPAGTDVTKLIAIFSINGSAIKVNSTVQVSGITYNDFTNPVTYTFIGTDGLIKNYTVIVNIGQNTVQLSEIERQAEIQRLQGIIAQLTAQIAEILAKQGANQIIQPTTDYIFTKNLRLGSYDPEVQYLQKYLNSHGFMVAQTGWGSTGNESAYFGLGTQKALIKFQETYINEILAPAGLTQGTGVVGFYTRKKLNGF